MTGAALRQAGPALGGPGVVYFLHAPALGVVKIGFCGNEGRLEARRVGEGARLRSRCVVIGRRDGGEQDERRLHMLHAASWVASEWFADDPAIRATVDGRTPDGRDLADATEIRSWLRTWAVSWREVSRVSGVGLATLADFADSGRVPPVPASVMIGRAFLLIERGVAARWPDLQLSFVR